MAQECGVFGSVKVLVHHMMLYHQFSVLFITAANGYIEVLMDFGGICSTIYFEL